LSFARLGHPFRSMYARVLTWSDDAWRYYGMLVTGEEPVGMLTSAAEDQVELLAGVNNAPAPDRYLADGLPAGRYLICTTLAEENNRGEVCGELVVE
jgi:hypothetical protein